MEGKIKALLENSLNELNLFVSSVILEKEGNNLFLRICLDGDKIIDLETIVLATKIIDPIVTEADLISEPYILDIYGKSKGSVDNEC